MSQHSRNNPDEAPVHDVFLGVVHVTTPRDDLTYQQRVDAHQSAMEPQFKTVDALKSLQAQLGCQPATSMADVYATQTAAIERLTKENVELGSALKHLLELEKKWMSRNKDMNDRYLKVCGEKDELKSQLADYQRYGEVRETQRLLREWREMKEALEDIAKNDKESKFGEGICCYGCDSPHIARECLTKINGGGKS